MPTQVTMRDEGGVIALLEKLDRAYARGKPILSDAEYDKLRAATQKRYPKNDYFRKAGAKIATRTRQEVKLPLPMGSLDKKRPAEAIKWLTSLPKDAELVITPKLDGLALLLEYRDGKFHRAFTRGEDGKTGFDVTENARHIQGVIPQFVRDLPSHPAKGRHYIIGEVIIQKDIFAKHYQGRSLEAGGNPFKNPRNFCIGMINRLKISDEHRKALRRMNFIGFNMVRRHKEQWHYYDKIEAVIVLTTHGFTSILNPARHGKFNPLENHWYGNGKRPTVEVLNALLKSWREKYPILQDGIVIDISQHKYRKDRGLGDPRPQYAYAVKPEVEDQISYVGVVDKIELNMSSRRLFKPVAILKKPLQFDGVDVQRVSLHNVQTVFSNQIGPGAKIKIIRSGDVIPRYISTVHHTKYRPPKHCPECATKLEMLSVDLYCPNENCTGPQLENLVRFFTVLKVDGLAEGIVEAMLDAGLDSVAKILTATPKQLAKVRGFAERKTQKIIDGLRKSVRDVPLARLMKASNSFADETLGFGERRFEPIIDKIGRKAILTGKIEPEKLKMQLLGIPGIGERVAEQFVAGLPKFREFYREIMNVVTLAADKRGGKLAGKVFVFTDFRDAEMEKLIEAEGGKIGSSVTNATTVLYAGSLTTTKAQRATALGIKIIRQHDAPAHLNKLLA